MKQIKKTLLSTAVLAGLAAGNVYAGEESCFEISNGLVDGNTWATIYTGEVCTFDNAVSDRALSLAPSAPISVAQELTRELNLGIGDADLGQATVPYATLGTNALRQLFFVPTSNIPGGSRFTIELETNAVTTRNPVNPTTGAGGAATFTDGQLYFVLLKENKDGAGNFVNFTLTNVASTDGPVTNRSSITFVVDATTSISAGSRLLVTNKSVNPQTFSGTRTAALAQVDTWLADAGEVNVRLLDDENCAEPYIHILASNARTDGGSTIIGGISQASELVVSQRQFTGFHDLSPTTGQGAYPLTAAAPAGTPAVGVVDALDPARLTEFDLTAAGNYVNIAGVDEVHYNKILNNSRPALDIAVNIQTNDRLVLQPTSSKDMKAARFMTRDRFGTIAGTAYDVLSFSTTATGALNSTSISLDEGATNLYYPLASLFNNAGGLQTNTFAVAEATGTANDSTRVMGYSYNVSLGWGIEFAAVQLKDKPLSCNAKVASHDISVNGTELKLPYLSTDNDMQWIRISNEHNSTAEVYFDIYGEEGTDQDMDSTNTNIFLGTIPANSSKVFFARRDILAAATANGYVQTEAPGTSGPGQQGKQRHTATFLVTAPSDKVHGVSVQKIPGGVDRVIPVLRNHDEVSAPNRAAIWQQ